MADNTLLYVALYEEVSDALADLDAVEQLHDDEMVGKYDAAVIDREEGKPHIVKRSGRPRVRVVPEVLGSGTLPRRELHDAAQELGSGESALMVVGEPTIKNGLDKAVTRAGEVVQRSVDQTTDERSRG